MGFIYYCQNRLEGGFFFFCLLKFIPFIVFRRLDTSGESIIFLLAVNSLSGGIGGLGCACLRKLIVYSSLSHSSWILACLRQSDFLWLEYYFVYCLIFFCFCHIAFLGELYHSSDIGGICFSVRGFSVVIVCLRGLPPFRLFMIKVCVLLRLSSTARGVFIFFLLRASLLALLYYLRLRVNSYIFFTRLKITNKQDLKRCISFYLFLMVNLFSAYIMFI